ncbi:SICAvar, type I (fragment), partial [Plasmodium knowlesi strain H]
FEKLKQLTMDGTSYPILSKHTSLKETVGCLLLHSYAKKMQGLSKCVIDSGLKKAFKVGANGLLGNCNLDEKLDDCSVTIGSATTKVQDKVNSILTSEENNIDFITEHMNEMTSLCQKLQCAVPNWFQKHSKGSSNTGNTKKTWCDFWDTTIKEELKKMFAAIKTNGGNSPNGVCTTFGDENPDSVERKACNHITAGLDYIKGIKDSGNGNPLLDRAVGCIALNLYADKIIELTKTNCPIDESKIKEMFTQWNASKNSCLNSANNNDCFQCKREDTYKSCHLSVADALVETSQQKCTSNTDRNEVQTELNKFLIENQDPSQSKSISQVKETLSTINDMSKSFCSRMQCAAKQYYANKKNSVQPKPPLSW